MRKVVFDVDDILWPCTKKVYRKAGADYLLAVTYDTNMNPFLSERQKSDIINIYRDEDTFKDIVWYSAAYELMSLESYNWAVYVNSHAFSERVKEIKTEQLIYALGIPEERIHIDVVGGFDGKKITSDTDVFVDDSPYNLFSSNAAQNFTISMPFNISNEGLRLLANKNVQYFPSLASIIERLKEV